MIDEPNSFLHPGAAKKLLAILKELNHQYIITTHSVEIIKALEPDVIHLTKWTGRKCIVETLNSEDVNDIRRLLQELGVRLSDVFGADNVLWVEGPTEEICFPRLLRALGHPLPAATAIVAMVNTGDLGGRRTRRSLAWEVYERLSRGSALIPPVLAFSFDREERTELEIEDLVRRSRGLAHFIPRQTYENYLVDADAISAVLRENEIDASPDNIQAWLKAHGQERQYFLTDAIAEVGSHDWFVSVNAPRLLSELFDEFSKDKPLRYDKLIHSVGLTEWLIKHKPEQLRELVDYLAALLTTVDH